MSDTQYLAAKTIDEAVEAHAKANGSARFLAGGTDLLVQIKSGIRKPNLVIDIKKIVELNSIQEISENEFDWTSLNNSKIKIKVIILMMFQTTHLKNI